MLNPDTALPLILHFLWLLLFVFHVMYVCMRVWVCECTAMSVETSGGRPMSLS